MSCACVTIQPTVACMPNSACTCSLILETILACSLIALNRGIERGRAEKGSNSLVHPVDLVDSHADPHGPVTSLLRLPVQPPPHLFSDLHKKEDLQQFLHLKQSCQLTEKERDCPTERLLAADLTKLRAEVILSLLACILVSAACSVHMAAMGSRLSSSGGLVCHRNYQLCRHSPSLENYTCIKVVEHSDRGLPLLAGQSLSPCQQDRALEG